MKKLRVRSCVTVAGLVAMGFMMVLPEISEAWGLTIRSSSRGWGWGSRSVKYKERGPTKDREYWRQKRAEQMEDAEKRRVQAIEDEFWRDEYKVPAAYGTINPRHLSEEAKQYLDTEREAEKQLARDRAEAARGAESAPPPKRVVEEAALNHVKAMGDYLRGLKMFTLSVEDIREEITPGGPVQIRGQHTYVVERPDKLRLKSQDARGQTKSMAYDGQTFTIVQAEPSFEMEIPAKGTLDTLAPQLYASHRMILPAGDLLSGDVHALVTDDCSYARYMGIHYIQGQPCHHVIGTSAGTDWQLWIASEGPPAPRRLLVRYRTEPGAPRYAANITTLN